ncbi:MAG: ChaN family lipoprotein [Bdellovibrio sp.]|nr:ChaN family lipoprotein [Bdellovibrio sp.]
MGPLQFQEKIFQYTKSKALSFEGPASKEYIQYQKQQRKDAGRKFKIVDEDALFESIATSQVIYLGDFHTFDQSTKNLERLLKILVEGKAQFTLGMEMVHAKHQNYIDQFLNRLISQEEFLESIDYHESWRFPWGHYQKFFELSQKHHFPIIGLNSEGALSTRDEFAAQKILHYLEHRPHSTMLILFGELHIITSRLPGQVNKLSPTPLTQTIIHQNLDQVYWKLASKKSTISHTASLVQFTPHEFCLISSPPWIKYESMVNWYDNLSDDPDFDIRDSNIQNGLKAFTSNMHENLLFLCQNLANMFGMRTKDDPIDSEALSDFNVYDYTNLDLILKKISAIEDRAARNFYRELVIEGRILKLPDSNVYYVSHYSINRLASVAGLHLFHWFLRDRPKQKNKKILSSKQNNFEKFRTFFALESFSHLCAKMLNPHRKCDLYLDLKRKSNTKDPDRLILKKALRLIGHPKQFNKNLATIISRTSPKQIHRLAQIVGKITGEILFENFIANNNERPSNVALSIFETYSSSKNLELLAHKCFSSADFKKGQKRYF